MKRYRHYKRDKAIILSIFGSVIEQEKYLELKKSVEKEFGDCDIFIAVSSRMVLKDLLKRGFDYKNLPQTLADVDMLGYRNIIVSSINLFPTDEHKMVKKVVKGFKKFSFSNIRVTNAILTKTKDTTKFLKELDETISKREVANLYIIHGTPRLDIKGIDSVSYLSNYLERKREINYTCSLEGAFPFFDIKNELIEKMKRDKIREIQIVPLLLVSGNHYIKDMREIEEILSSHFQTSIVKSITKSDKFNLLEIPAINQIIINNIKEEIIKLGH